VELGKRKERKLQEGCNTMSTSDKLSYFLQLLITEDMRRPLYFNRLKSHLKDADKDVYDIISDIEKSESRHNQQVSDFMKNLRVIIRNAIYSIDESGHGNCKTDLLKEYNEVKPDYRPHFILNEIVQYYADKATGKKTTMRVWRPNPDTFYLSRETDYGVAAAAGDEQTMLWILHKIESLPIIEKLKGMQQEGMRINDLINNKMRSRVANLILQIDDERFGGKCDFESH
jgi:hypothetical protein